MDKTKTLEMLSGMKFMQRKEETKRRQRLEIDQQKQLEEQMQAKSGARHGTSGMSIGSASPFTRKKATATILYDSGFPRESYSLARRSFLRKVSSTSVSTNVAEDTAVGPSGGGGECVEDAKCAGNENFEEEPHRGDTEDVHSAGSEDEDDATMYDPTAVGGNSSGKRFCVKLRAPALPKGLEKQVVAEERKKRRRQEE
ncbi:hypothetical protein C3747_69g146 [Trypanosoma cruzi]|uniref:Uncharacterized protein n=2 Tax=Trypanosoma cruzi TaxID=5693 RepID=Q4D3H1_TRYCC|nr:hypothetical protein, conserved [Trypanosoma cruzi]EAN87066.1 hypothetical protein, conserved [Trypanosoma cruzi]PWV10431.1 hypothetical protein C3747_69g146 [Trypanosoma cruzi]RNC58115.1 hypothetical protein TcCL_ESM04315 [Trypanosoma cruzi]|eukprot:XP_808917.1 hypothetical protein [Trypanosoma cruzi strain CL Brener]